MDTTGNDDGYDLLLDKCMCTIVCESPQYDGNKQYMERKWRTLQMQRLESPLWKQANEMTVYKCRNFVVTTLYGAMNMARDYQG